MAPASARAEGEISATSDTGVTEAAGSAPRTAGVAAPPLGPERGALPEGVLVLGALEGGVLVRGLLVGAVATAVDNSELL